MLKVVYCLLPGRPGLVSHVFQPPLGSYEGTHPPAAVKSVRLQSRQVLIATKTAFRFICTIIKCPAQEQANGKINVLWISDYKYLQQHVLLSQEQKTARFLYSYVFIQLFANLTRRQWLETKTSRTQTDQGDGLTAVTHKMGHQKGCNGAGISCRRRDITWVLWFLYYRLLKYLSLLEKENSSSTT